MTTEAKTQTAPKTDTGPTDTGPTTDGPDLSDAMYCEHRRTRVHCEDCRAAEAEAAAKTAKGAVPPTVA